MIYAIISTFALLGIIIFGFSWKIKTIEKNSLLTLVFATLLLWIIPWGLVIIIPIVLLLSFSSPAARESWKKDSKRRVIISSSLVLIIFLTAFSPVSLPSAPDDWLLISQENPDASFWPSSEQYTWLYDSKVISVLNIRTPHTFSEFKMAESSLALGLMMNLDDLRLRQSMKQLSINPDTFKLEEINTEAKHRYKGDEYTVLRERILLDGLDDVTVGFVLVVAIPNFGGEMTLLTVVRSSLDSDDIWEEKIVTQWLQFQE